MCDQSNLDFLILDVLDDVNIEAACCMGMEFCVRQISGETISCSYKFIQFVILMQHIIPKLYIPLSSSVMPKWS